MIINIGVKLSLLVWTNVIQIITVIDMMIVIIQDVIIKNWCHVENINLVLWGRIACSIIDYLKFLFFMFRHMIQIKSLSIIMD